MKRYPLLIFIFALCASGPVGHAQDRKPLKTPKNVIFMIGDGMGVGHVTAASLVKPLRMEECPVVGLVKTQSYSNLITDSAAGGTAMATGVRTINGYVGLDPEEKPLKSLVSIAREAGKATGIVVTSEIPNATPASFVAHNKSRVADMEITLAFVENGPDLFIGSGMEFFTKRRDQRDLLAELREKGYTVAETMEELQKAKGPKLAGILGDGQKRFPRASERDGYLPKATAKALEVLSQNPDGFFLMIEGSQIDWGSHKNDTKWILEEMHDFDDAIGVVLDFIKTHGDTLLVISADHETGGLHIMGGDIVGDDFGETPVRAGFAHKHHTGAMVPLFAAGAGSEVFSGVYRNTDIFKRMEPLVRNGK